MYMGPQQHGHIQIQYNNFNVNCVLCRPMPRDSYSIRVSVDGVPFPDSAICNGNLNSGHCKFYVSFQLMQHCSVMCHKFGSISCKSFLFFF